LLTLPVTGAHARPVLFVINALMFYFAASLLDGFHVTGFVAALIGSLPLQPVRAGHRRRDGAAFRRAERAAT
jgi:uncharacterized membrane protein YvlD (DUF360 family)